MFAMETVYLGSAAIGGFLMLLQVIAGMLGGHSDVDADVDFDAAEGAGGVSFRTIVAFLTFFGIAGMAATKGGLGPASSGLCALAAGSLAFWIAGFLMSQLYRLRSSGSIDIANAVGVEARVYLRVPAARLGEGKVTEPLQGRTVEVRAVTAGRELASGEYCRVAAVIGASTVEVEALAR